VLGHRADIRDPCWAGHPDELQELLNDQLDANRCDSTYLSFRSSAYCDASDSDSSSSDGDDSQDEDRDSGSCSSDGAGSLIETDSGAGSNDDAAAALRTGAEHVAGAIKERAQAGAAKVTKHKAAAAANAAKQHEAAAAAKKLKIQSRQSAPTMR
jgi:hypothetical protein